MAKKETLQKVIIIFGLIETTLGSMMQNKLLMIMGTLLSVIGAIMIVGVLR